MSGAVVAVASRPAQSIYETVGGRVAFLPNGAAA